MITNPEISLAKLKSFFENDLSSDDKMTELSVPELIELENTNAISSNPVLSTLMIDTNNTNLQKIDLKNMYQTPYILTGKNLTEVNLESLQRVEIGTTTNQALSYLSQYVIPMVLRETKIQKLNLPNFIGSPEPTSSSNSDIDNTIPATRTCFWKNYWLKDVNMGNSYMKQENNSQQKFNGFWFRDSYFLKSLRLNYPYVIPMVGIGGLSTTPIAPDNGNGYIYVPEDLIDEYQASTEWQRFSSKIISLDRYEEEKDKIDDSWATILNNCYTGNTSKYKIGDTKTVYIDDIPMQFIIVGKNVDTLYTNIEGYNQNRGKAALSWALRTISYFSPTDVAGSFSSDTISFNGNENFHTILDNIYNNIEDTVKTGIKPVIKYSKGYILGVPNTYIPSDREEYVWPLSAVEIGKATAAEGYFTYEYFDKKNSYITTLNYYLGDTYTNVVNGQKIYVALRDYSNQTSRPDCLLPVDPPTGSNEVQDMTITQSGTSPYLIIGFCT